MSSSADNPPPIPTLQLSTAVTATDHGQIIALVAWLCFIAGILLSLVRLYIRWPLNRLAGKDDVTYAVSALFAIVQTSIIINAVSNGLGRTESELERKQVIDAAKVSLPISLPSSDSVERVRWPYLAAWRLIGDLQVLVSASRGSLSPTHPRSSLIAHQAIYATDLIYLASTWTGKLSVSFLFTRLAQESNKRPLGWALSALISTFGVVSFISVAARLDTAQPWLYHDEDGLTPILARWIATGIMSILTDIIVTGMSIYLVWDLNMASKSKSLVITAFTLRLFVMPVIIARLVTLTHVQVDDLSFSYSLPEVMTQLEMYCNLITTTLPCLRLFLTAWNSSFMDIGLAGIDHDAYRERKTPPLPLFPPQS
jgi:hypothetical protein